MRLPINERIKRKIERLTKSERIVASYISTNLKQLPFLTAARIARDTGVSQMTVSRTLRSIGYKGLDKIKGELNNTLQDVPWLIRDRYLQFVESDPEDKRSVSLDREVKALIGVHEVARTRGFEQAAVMIAEADGTFVAGFQTLRGMASDFSQRLEYVRDNVRLLTGDNSTYAEVFAAGVRRRVLIIIEGRRYSRQSKLLAAEARRRRTDTIIIADSTCAWASDFTKHVFLVQADVGLFWDSHAPLACFLNLLCERVIGLLGSSVRKRIRTLTELQGSFEGFDD